MEMWTVYMYVCVSGLKRSYLRFTELVMCGITYGLEGDLEKSPLVI